MRIFEYCSSPNVSFTYMNLTLLNKQIYNNVKFIIVYLIIIVYNNNQIYNNEFNIIVYLIIK